MATRVRIKTIVLPGGKIEITNPDLVPGQEATVVITVEDSEPTPGGHVIDILTALPGHQLFQNAEEVDSYVQQEREAWEG